MKVKNLKWIIALGIVALAVSACGNSNATLTPPPTRVATQTPWIIYVPVTTTPEPTVLPLLPTAEGKTTTVPTRPPTRAVVAKPTVAPTKPPVVAAPIAKPTAAPACAYSQPDILEPNDGAERRTWETRPGSDTFIFKWNPPPNIGGEDLAYKIQISSTRPGGKPAGGDVVYITHNKFVSDGQGRKFVYDAQRVHGLAQGGDDVTVVWNISVVKFTGTISEQGYLTGTAVECTGSRTANRTIILKVLSEG